MPSFSAPSYHYDGKQEVSGSNPDVGLLIWPAKCPRKALSWVSEEYAPTRARVVPPQLLATAQGSSRSSRRRWAHVRARFGLLSRWCRGGTGRRSPEPAALRPAVLQAAQSLAAVVTRGLAGVREGQVGGRGGPAEHRGPWAERSRLHSPRSPPAESMLAVPTFHISRRRV
jgi:hypothetical protein